MTNNPWGTLTGIRPVKRVVQMLQQNQTDEVIQNIFEKTFSVSKEKTDLSLAIAKTELKVMKNVSEDAVGLYIDIPFCPSRCVYCSFASMPVSEMGSFIEPYLNALYEELDMIAKIIQDLRLHVCAVYIGGGTPTSILEIELDNLLYKINKTFDLSQCTEFTVEAGRPDTITDGKLAVMQKHGVDRISINPQTMNDTTLKTIGRRHTVEQIYNAYALAEKYNFRCINMDLIAGLPNENSNDFQYSVDALINLAPQNITVHTMSIKRASVLNHSNGVLQLPAPETVSDMIRYAHNTLGENGYIPYYLYRQKNILGNQENTGFSRGNTEGVYNICMMSETRSVFSAGVGAVTKLVKNDRIERIFNVKDVREYLKRKEEMYQRKNYVYTFYEEMTN